MTTRQALDGLSFWLDESVNYWTDAERCIALNRAVTEWIQARVSAIDTTEQLRRELGLLIGVIEGAGSRLVLRPGDRVWRILALSVLFQKADSSEDLPVPVRPCRIESASGLNRNPFWQPTDAEPTYTTKADNGTEVISIQSARAPYKIRMVCFLYPHPLSETRPGYEWQEVPASGHEDILQRAARMLMQQRQPDYSAQIKVEQPLSTAIN